MFVDPKQVLSSTADVVLDSSPKVKIKEASPSLFYRFLSWLKIRPLIREYEMSPLSLGNVIRVSRILLNVDIDIYSPKGQEAIYQAMASHGEAMAQVVAIGLLNTKKEPTKKFVRYLMENLTTADLQSICKMVITQMDVTSFTVSIISIKGMSLLKAGESIASGAPSAD